MPTQRQRTAALKVSENIGSPKPKPIGEILIESGYSKSISETPSNVIESKGFLQVLEEAGVTDDKISQVMQEGLDATDREIITHYKYDKKTGKRTESNIEIREYPNYSIRHKYLETAVKVKGHAIVGDIPTGNTYNTFIQQNNLDPNTVDSKDLVENTLDMLMERTKRKA